MNIPFIIFVALLILVIVFFKDFHAFVYFIVMVDIFLKVISYLRINVIKDSALGFLKQVPADVPAIIKSLDLGMFTEILIILYIIVYMVFEGFLIRNFIRRKF